MEPDTIYEQVANSLREYGYAHVTANDVRKIDHALTTGTELPPGHDANVYVFAGRLLREARDGEFMT